MCGRGSPISFATVWTAPFESPEAITTATPACAGDAADTICAYMAAWLHAADVCMRASVLHMHACTAHTQTHRRPHTRTHARMHTRTRTHARECGLRRRSFCMVCTKCFDSLRGRSQMPRSPRKTNSACASAQLRSARQLAHAGGPRPAPWLRGTDRTTHDARRLPVARTRGLPRLSALCRSSRPHPAPAWCAPFHPRRRRRRRRRRRGLAALPRQVERSLRHAALRHAAASPACSPPPSRRLACALPAGRRR
jgi:hypothetical protein